MLILVIALACVFYVAAVWRLMRYGPITTAIGAILIAFILIGVIYESVA